VGGRQTVDLNRPTCSHKEILHRIKFPFNDSIAYSISRRRPTGLDGNSTVTTVRRLPQNCRGRGREGLRQSITVKLLGNRRSHMVAIQYGGDPNHVIRPGRAESIEMPSLRRLVRGVALGQT
jgi:hypothetical protein